MSEFDHDLFEDESAYELPPRSQLFHLKPIGSCTAQQESLLNFVHRLARAHQLRVMDLVTKLILPRTDIQIHAGRNRFQGEYSRTINGYSKYAFEFVASLSQLTQVDDLQAATFLPWRHMLDGKGSGLLRKTRSWCPECIAEAEASGEPPPFPLLWTCLSINHCIVHMCAMETECLRCGASQRPINDTASYGRCCECGTSLGWRSSVFKPVSIDEQDRFNARALSEMIKLGSAAEAIATPQNLARAISQVADISQTGSLYKLERAIKTGRGSLSSWANLSNKPGLKFLLEVCYRIGVTPLELLREGSQLEPRIRTAEPATTRSKNSFGPDQLRALEADIFRIIQSDTEYVDAQVLARRHGTTFGLLKYRLPETYELLRSHRCRVRAKRKQEKIDAKIKTSREVVRELFLQSTNVPRTRLAIALKARGLDVRSPEVRAAAFDELEKLREGLH